GYGEASWALLDGLVSVFLAEVQANSSCLAPTLRVAMRPRRSQRRYRRIVGRRANFVSRKLGSGYSMRNETRPRPWPILSGKPELRLHGLRVLPWGRCAGFCRRGRLRKWSGQYPSL